jgi:hypothetical protein
VKLAWRQLLTVVGRAMQLPAVYRDMGHVRMYSMLVSVCMMSSHVKAKNVESWLSLLGAVLLHFV